MNNTINKMRRDKYEDEKCGQVGCKSAMSIRSGRVSDVVIAMSNPEVSLRVTFGVGSSGESFVASSYRAGVRPFSSVSNLVLCQSCLTLERSSTDLAAMFLHTWLRGTTRTSNVTTSYSFRRRVSGAGD